MPPSPLPVVLAAIAASAALFLLVVLFIHRRELSVQTVLLAIDRLSTLVGKTAGWAIVVLTAAVSYEVFARYIFRAPTTWAFDVAYILYGTLFMLAGPYALARNNHVRGDFLYRNWMPRMQAGVDLVLYLLFFFPGILALCYAGYGFANFSWLINEHSSNSPDGPPLYHFKTLIPVVGGLMTLQGLAEVTRAVICIRTGRWPARLHDVEETERRLLERSESEGLRRGDV